MFPEDAFYGSGSPKKIKIDDSVAERDGLRKNLANSRNTIVHISFSSKYLEMATQY